MATTLAPTWDETTEIPSWDETTPAEETASPFTVPQLAPRTLGTPQSELERNIESARQMLEARRVGNGMEPGSEFLTAVAKDPVGFLKSIPGDVAQTVEQAAAFSLRNIAKGLRAIAADPNAPQNLPPRKRVVISPTEIKEETYDPIDELFRAGEPLYRPRGTVLQPEGNEFQKIVSGLTTPGMIATFPFAATKPVQIFFLSQTAPGAIESAAKLVDPSASPEERTAAATGALLNSIFSVGLAKHLVKPAPPVQGPLPTGEILQTPRGALPPEIKPTPTEVQNASQVTSPEGIPGPQVRAGMDETTPLRQPGETPGTRPPQPEAKAAGVPEALKPPELMTPDEHARFIMQREGWDEKDMLGQRGGHPILPSGNVHKIGGGMELVRTVVGARNTLNRAIDEKKPISSALFDEYNLNSDRPIKLPDGYVKEGDKYIYKSPSAQEATAPTTVDKLAAQIAFQKPKPPVTLADIESGKPGIGTESAMASLVAELRQSKDPISVIQKWAQARDRASAESAAAAKAAEAEKDVTASVRKINGASLKSQLMSEAIQNVAQFGEKEFTPETIAAAKQHFNKGSTLKPTETPNAPEPQPQVPQAQTPPPQLPRPEPAVAVKVAPEHRPEKQEWRTGDGTYSAEIARVPGPSGTGSWVGVLDFTPDSRVGGFNQATEFSPTFESAQGALKRLMESKGLPSQKALKITKGTLRYGGNWKEGVLQKQKGYSPEEHKKNLDFVQTLKNVGDELVHQQTQERRPQAFGSGPPEYGQWLTDDDIKRIPKLIQDYGDFWLVLKWNSRPREIIKASDLAKHYDKIVKGAESSSPNEYLREVFVRDNPFEGFNPPAPTPAAAKVEAPVKKLSKFKDAEAEQAVRDLYEQNVLGENEIRARAEIEQRLTPKQRAKYQSALGAIDRRLERASTEKSRVARLTQPSTEPVDLGHPPEESITLTEPKPAKVSKKPAPVEPESQPVGMGGAVPAEPTLKNPIKAFGKSYYKNVSGEWRQKGKPSATVNVSTRNALDEILNPAISVGPGAKTVGEPGKPQLTQLTDSLRGMAESSPRTDSIKSAFDMGKAASAVKDRVSESIFGLKAVGDYLKQKLIGYPVWNSWKAALGDRHLALTESVANAKEFVRNSEKAIPDKTIQEAISDWIDTGGKDDLLAKAQSETNPQYKAGYAAARNLTPEQINIAQNAKNYFEARLQDAIDNGILEGGLEDYIHRYYEKDSPFKQALLSELRSGIFTGRPAFAKQRVFEYDLDAEKAGYHPVKSFIKRIAAYDLSLNKAIADRQAVRAMTQIKMPDGRPLADVAGIGVKVEGEGKGATLIKPSAKRKDANNKVNDRSDYKARDYPALRRWKWATTDADGNPILVQGDVVIHPDGLKLVDPLFRRSAVRQNPVGRLALATSSTIKQTMLDLSGFHPVQITVHGWEHRSFKPVEKIDFENPDVRGLIRGGLVAGETTGYELFSEGLTGSSLTRHIPYIGDKLQSYNHWLFNDYIPRLKVATGLHALERNRARFKNLSADELYHLTANQMNNAFGELNYEMLGRSKTTQDVLRLALLAPDFLEARAGFVGQAATKYGREQFAALALGAATLYVTARIINKLLNGEYHFEPNNAFAVVYNKKAYSLRTVQGDVLHAITDPGKFIYNRLNPVYGRTLMEFFSKRDSFGRQRSGLQQLKDFATTIVPISLRGLINPREQNLWESFLNAIGVTERRSTSNSTVYQLAENFKKANDIQTEPGEFVYDSDKDPYRGIKEAAIFSDVTTTAREIRRAIAKGHPAEKIYQHFANSARRPFTGTVANDAKFVEQLSDDNRLIYEDALRERKQMLDKFMAAYEMAAPDSSMRMTVDTSKLPL